MPTWSRSSVDARRATWPLLPEGLVSWGGTGKGQFRDTLQVGWQWQEVCQTFKANSVAGAAFLAAVSYALRTKTVYDVDCPLYRALLGNGAPNALVRGASQTGSALLIDGCPAATVARAGDLFRVNPATLIRRVLSDATAGADGITTLNFEPPLTTAPADNAPVTIGPTALFKAVLVAVDMPDTDESGYMDGLRLTWREQPG